MTREEALQAIKEKMDYYESDKRLRGAIETLIPELTESEDERIIKTLQAYVKNRNWPLNGPTQDEVLAYLEKQKECLADNNKTSTDEDERIRKSLIEFLTIIKGISESGRTTWTVRKGDAEMCKSSIAYLEKQKDASKAIEVVERIDKYIDEHLANAHDMKESNPDKKYYRGWDDALGEMARILQDVYSEEKQKEQKPLMCDGVIEDKKRDIVAAIRKYYPADYAEYLTSFLMGLSPEDNSDDEYGQEMLGIAYKLMYEHIPENLRTQEFWDSLKFMREYTGRVAIIHSYQKPAEWSEEERKILDSIIDDYEKAAKSFCGYAGKIWLLKAIRDGEITFQSPQKLDASKLENYDPVDVLNRIKTEWPMAWEKVVGKQEWSEEDSDNLERVDNYLWMLDDYVGDDCAMPQGKTDKIRGNIQEVLSPWLKNLPERFNLQPEEEWSEEDEKMLQSIIKDFRDGKVSTIGQEQWLKSLKPSWKPSKEQIKYLLMLADYFESEGGISNAKTLREFSEQLEKLI